MKILLIIWTDPSWHPAFISTSQVLAEAGHQVRILGRTPAPEFAVPGPVDFGANTRLETKYPARGGWRGHVDFLRFCQWAFRASRRFPPEVIIGFDIHGLIAAFAASLIARRAKLIYHNFDLVPCEGLSPIMRVLKRIELFAAARANRVIVSSPGRGEILQEQVELERKPVVVMNCQRLNAPRRQTGELQQILSEQGLSFERLVVRMGLIGPGNAVEATIRSVVQWKGDWGMIFAGAPYQSYLEEMRALVKSLGLEKKVIFLPSVPYSLWYDCLSAADLGIALYVPENVNNQTMAGAGNKLNLYLSEGIPSILPDLPDFVEFNATREVGEMAHADDPGAIAGAVSEILSNPQKHAFYARNAQRVFETEFNFEAQYQPILDYIEAN